MSDRVELSLLKLELSVICRVKMRDFKDSNLRRESTWREIHSS